jgi:hypothetical protein
MRSSREVAGGGGGRLPSRAGERDVPGLVGGSFAAEVRI